MTRDELIMLFYDGELDEVEAAEARALLERDPEARALLARLTLVSSVVNEIGDAQPTPADITSEVMARVLSEPRPTRPDAPVVSLASQRDRTRSRRALATVTAGLAVAAGLALLLSRHDPQSGSTARTQVVMAAPAGAISAPEPDPPEQSVAIERIDFGEDPGAIFLVPGVEERTLVVWTMDASADNGPEIEL